MKNLQGSQLWTLTQRAVQASTEEIVRNYVLESTKAAHLMTSPQKVFDNPKQNIDNDKPNRPVSITGFRPM